MLFLCLCSLTFGAQTGAGSRTQLERKIPFELSRNKIIIPVQVNDSREMKIILDTGMPSTGLLLFDSALIDELGLSGGKKYLIDGAGKGMTTYSFMFEGAKLTLGEADFFEQKLLILQSDTMAGTPTDGVVGNTLFGSSAVKIDYEKKIITLTDPSKLNVDHTWEEIDLTFNKNGIPFVNAQISAEGETLTGVSLYIDSASSEALELLVKPDMKFSLPEDLEDRYLGRGLSGDFFGLFGRINTLKIGSFILREVPTAFPKTKVRSRQKGADGILCNKTLQKFNLIFDYSGKKLYIKPNLNFSEPFDRFY